MAQKYAGKNPSNPNCVGENISPPLSWSNAPEKTQSFAIVMHDQEGRSGLGVAHWVAYAIPASKSSLAEGEANSANAKDHVNGKNTLGQTAYLGPCPPKGTGQHHYVLTLIATDLAPNAFQAGLTMQQMLDQIGSHALGATGLVGRFGR
jgi:Raf kinase inhibitor-like YbhB/YbcL family protein